MSEPNKARTIPLHIADQAVAACEAEIQKLKEENARLKGEDYAYNELGSLVPRHLLEHWMNESASLKAEVEQIRKTVDEHLTPIPEHTTVREVERLCTAWSLMSNSLNAQWKRIEQLKAEVERLTDTLNKLVKTPPEATGGVRVKVDFWTQYGSRLPSSYETFWENAAKEGKPSV